MGKMRASLLAGRSLVMIVTALMVPVVVLSYFLITGYQRDLDFTNKEIQGLKILEAGGPVILQIASGQEIDPKALAEFEKTEILAHQLGVDEEEEEHIYELLEKPKLTNLAKIEAIQDFLTQAATKSNLILDPEAESYFMISMTVHGLAQFIVANQKLVEKTKSAAVDGKLELAEGFDIQKINGAVEAALHGIYQAHWNARAASTDTASYDDGLVYLNAIKQRVDLQTKDTLLSTLSMRAFSSDQVLATGRSVRYSSVLAGSLWKQAVSKIGNLLNVRVAIQRNQTAISMGVGFLSVIFALGMAVNLFKSTLKKLDDVEQQRLDAVAARLESEEMAGQINAVNAQVTALNTDLADNIKKLQNAQEELVNKGRMEQLGQLTATIAHEIRNPLGAVRTSAFLLERKLRDKGLGVEGQIDRINKGVVRCDNIITQLLDFSRTKQLTCSLGNLDDWLANVVREEAARLPSSVMVECSLGLQDLQVPFDPVRLQRAVVNLLSNASEAMVGSGEDPSRMHSSHPRIQIATFRAGPHVVIRVSDNGPGITAENIGKIRNPLFTTKSFGTGLGIPAIEQIANQHGGRLNIESQPGKGAVFSILIPAESQALEVA